MSSPPMKALSTLLFALALAVVVLTPVVGGGGNGGNQGGDRPVIG